MAASGSSTSIEVTLCCPPGPTKHPHEAPNPPGNTHGHAMDPTLDTHDGHTEKQGEDTGWVCSAGVEKGQDPSSAFRVSAIGEMGQPPHRHHCCWFCGWSSSPGTEGYCQIQKEIQDWNSSSRNNQTTEVKQYLTQKFRLERTTVKRERL